MILRPLQQRTVLEDASHIALRLPLSNDASDGLATGLAALHPGGCFPLVEDPRSCARAVVVGMMVLRPADHAWLPNVHGNLREQIRAVSGWCFDVAGLGGSWPISGGNALDAYRLALQYGTMDAVLAGSATMLREGTASASRRAHLWQPYSPLSWAVLRPHRDVLEPAIAAVRENWQRLGVLSMRRYPAQIAVSRSGRPSGPDGNLFDASIFRSRHPDGSPIESYILTGDAGAERLRAHAKAKGRSIDEQLLVASLPGNAEDLDIARVPELLRSRLDARLVQHDGGAISLGAFLDAGAIAQLNLTLMRDRSVRDVLSTSTRIDDRQRRHLLETWSGRPRLFPAPRGVFAPEWTPFYAVSEQPGEEAGNAELPAGGSQRADGVSRQAAGGSAAGAAGEALVVSLDVRG